MCSAASITIGVIADTHVSLTQSAEQNWGDTTYSGSPFGWRLLGYHAASMAAFNTNTNAASVDFAICVGDLVGSAADDATRITHFAEYVDYIDGTEDTQDADMYYALGHWEFGSLADSTDWNNFFDNTNGIGTIIPAAGAAPTNPWWPDLPVGINAQSHCAYTFDNNGFTIIVLCNPFAGVTMGSAGQFGAVPDAKTQNQWFQDRLDEAEAATQPVIVFTHQPLKEDYWQGSAVADAATAITGMEAQTISPIVFQAHVHSYQGVIEENGVLYINLRGDAWGMSETDTGRLSHAIVTITGPDWTDAYGQRCGVDLVGYGDQPHYKTNATLVGHWKLNEPTGTSGASSILDYSGNAYHGTPASATTSISAPLDRGTEFALSIDIITDSAAPIVDFPFSMTAWIKTTATGEMCITSLGGAAIANRYVGLITEITAKCSTKALVGGNTTPASTTAVNDGVWHFLAGVWTSATLRDIYVDGRFEATNTDSRGLPTMDKVAIGGYADSTPSNSFVGDINDVRIYSGALTANQIANLWLQGASQKRRSRYSGVRTTNKTRYPRNRYNR